jgi:hypothetical protein
LIARDSINQPDIVEQRSIAPGRFSPRGIAIRLFLTCWVVYGLHAATNTVREIYLALAIGDHFSFRVDEYANLHPDLFEKPGYGWHIGNNPGASMIAAVPYAALRPLIDRVVARVNSARAASHAEPPEYNSPWPMVREFFRESWRRGYDVKFGLAAIVMQGLVMAPTSAAIAVLMFFVCRRLVASDRTALWLALLYAFGTPTFFRTGYLNQNLLLGHIAFAGFVVLWDPGGRLRWSAGTRLAVAGAAGGLAVLMDYSGVVILGGLFAYALVKRVGGMVPAALRYGLGALGPLLLLWLYQWRSFGDPFHPGQHWMPPVEWIELGYRGYGPPQLELLWSLAFDYRYGFFVSGPLFLLALAAPFVRTRLARVEVWSMLALFAALWVFFSGSNYTRLQFNTGVRYMAPMFPFMFVPAAMVLVRLPRRVVYAIALVAVTVSWCLAMHRDVERGFGVFDPILHVFVGGFELPVLTVISQMSGSFGELVARGVSPLPLFALTGAILYGVWRSPAGGPRGAAQERVAE